MQSLGDFLGAGYDPGMIAPYADGKTRMTDGAHALSQQVGDPNFYRHGAIKREVADQWRAEYHEDFLGRDTWELAGRFGYENPFQAPPPVENVPVPLVSASARMLPSIVAVPREGRRVKRSTLAGE